LLTKITSREFRLDVEHLFFDPPKEHDAMFALHGDVRRVVVIIFSSGDVLLLLLLLVRPATRLKEVEQKEFNASQLVFFFLVDARMTSEIHEIQKKKKISEKKKIGEGPSLPLHTKFIIILSDNSFHFSHIFTPIIIHF